MKASVELSACVEWLYADTPDIAPRIASAARDGITAVEFWDWRDKDLDAVQRALEEHHVTLTSFVSESRGDLTDPATHDEFLTGVATSCQVARRLGCGRLVVLGGTDRPGVGAAVQRGNIVTALRAGATIAADNGITLVLEPLNTRVDHPGVFVADTDRALDILAEIDHPRVQLLYDVYHSAVMGEDLPAVIARAAGRIGHVQIADTHGRHEPGTGDIDWTAVRTALDAAGYDGPIGLEYQPTGSTGHSVAATREIWAAA